jgi:hypothetical protein
LWTQSSAAVYFFLAWKASDGLHRRRAFPGMANDFSLDDHECGLRAEAPNFVENAEVLLDSEGKICA